MASSPPSSSQQGSKDDVVIRWGILGTGSIANDMVQVLKQLSNVEVVAIGSRSQEGAKRFGDKWGIPKQYNSYEALAADPDVDVVYVATPSLRHPEDCLMALKNGKAVLCEKTMAPNHKVARNILQTAQESNLLFVHGVWSRFFPAMQKVRDLIFSEGTIGHVRSARVSFCQNDGAGSCSALLETGIYCAQFLQWVLSTPDDAASDDASRHPVVRGACRTQHASGTDEHVSALLEFPGNKFGSFECSLAHCSERSAAVYGTEGVIEIPFPFWCPTKVKVTCISGQASQKWDGPTEYVFPLPEDVKALPVAAMSGAAAEHVPGFNFVNSQGLAYEAEEVNRCFREGLLETPLFTSAQCLDILRIISEIDTMPQKKPVC